MRFFHDMSLKIKMVLLGVGLTGSMLSTYGYLALRDFQKDKLAYVLDTSLSHARSTALQVRSELEGTVTRIQFLMRGYDYSNSTFHPYSKSIFKGEKNFDGIWTYKFDSNLSRYTENSALVNNPLPGEHKNPLSLLEESFATEILDNEMSLRRLPNNSEKWLLSLRYNRSENQPPLIVIAVLNTSHFIEIFNSDQMQDTYLIDHKDKIAIEPKVSTYKIQQNEVLEAARSTMKKIAAHEGIHIHESLDKNDSWLISLANVGTGSLKVFTLVPKSVALEAVRALIIKSILFIMFLFFVTLFLSIVSSASLTSSLKNLLAATIKISKGDFNVEFKDKVGGEIGALASGFNKMATEIQRLLGETAEKARMENELKTAQLVQATLFPKENLNDGPLKIHGYYAPAGECSGDWWHYEVVGHRVFFGIGDATGHGVPAALLTSAARSAATIVQNFPDLKLSDIMRLFNRSIFNTADGKVMMTFFLGLYDMQSEKLEYCNASHEPPYVLRHSDKPIKKNDLEFLSDCTGPRLGQDPNSTYESAQITLKPKDRIVLYTDGVTELHNNSGNMLGERKFIQTILNSKNEAKTIAQSMEDLAKSLETFRENAPLADDVTYFMVERSDTAA